MQQSTLSFSPAEQHARPAPSSDTNGEFSANPAGRLRVLARELSGLTALALTSGGWLWLLAGF
ncbi:MAG: hypothetical protein RQ729_03020 [Wenzhouxiangellaceae bacterium]|nr:hypothetical protein [Wenzhouxiangellaceae bacterium]